jgi:hypothetical protein
MVTSALSVVERCSRKARIRSLAIFCALTMGSPLLAQSPSLGFCDIPTALPRNTPLASYSPVVCFQYGNLQPGIYTLKSWLLETGSSTTNRPPVLNPIGNRTGAAGQPLECPRWPGSSTWDVSNRKKAERTEAPCR